MKTMFSETMTLILNAQDEFLCSLPSSPTAFWAQLPEMFLISVPKMDHISFPTPLSHQHLHSRPSPWREAPEGSGLMMIGRRIKFNFWSEFTADPALTISWVSFQPECFSEMVIHVLRGETPSLWLACLQGSCHFTTSLQSHSGIKGKCACRSLHTESMGRSTAA